MSETTSYPKDNHTRLLLHFKNDISKELGDEFKNLHTREEVKAAISVLKKEFADGHYDGLFDPDLKVKQLLKVTVPKFKRLLESDEKKPLVDRLFPVMYSKENAEKIKQAIKIYCEYAEMVPTIEDIDKKFMTYLRQHYKEYQSSSDYMSRLVRHRLANISPEFVCVKALDGEKHDEQGYKLDDDGKRVIETESSTRLLILKQFIKQFNWCDGVKDLNQDRHSRGFRCEKIKEIAETQYDGKYEDMALGITEDIFDQIPTSGNDAVAHARIVKISKDLAKGFFASSHSTRENLYIFAIAFEMTVSKEPKKELLPDDPEYYTDITKNLFFDYYCANLVNFKGQHAESAVDGYGINYKNMAEITYLYYIAKDKMTALDKFVSARKMIEACKQDERAKSLETLLETPGFDSEGTKYYAESFFAELLKKSEKEFKDFLLDNYECTANGEYGLTVTQYTQEHRTASIVYDQLLVQTKKIREKIDVPPEYFECSFDEEICCGDKAFKNVIKSFNDLANNEKTVREYLEKANGRISLKDIWNANQSPILDYSDRIVFLRTDLVIAYSFYVVAKIAQSGRSKTHVENFSKFYDYFCQTCDFECRSDDFGVEGATVKGVDMLLLQCGYQAISPKNIFDLMVIYHTFKKCRLLFSLGK